MKTQYPYIEFVELAKPHRKTLWFECRNSASRGRLGVVKWYAPWRRYCYFPEQASDVVYSQDCLENIAQFVCDANAEHKKQNVSADASQGR